MIFPFLMFSLFNNPIHFDSLNFDKSIRMNPQVEDIYDDIYDYDDTYINQASVYMDQGKLIIVLDLDDIIEKDKR
jgi:hypothetical protein